VGPNPTDRAKPGVKESLLVEGEGGPLAVVLAGANVPDAHLLADTLDATIVARPEPAPEFEQHLALDRGYDTPAGWEAAVERDYEPHIPPQRGPRSAHPKRYPARRWVVERTLAWLHQCRGLLIRWEKKAENYLGLVKVACILLWFRRWQRLSLLR
jgi:transposase